MVLLGDNWFAERSAKQSIEIAQRRMQSTLPKHFIFLCFADFSIKKLKELFLFLVVEKQLDDLKKEYEHIRGNLTFTEQFEQLKTVSATSAKKNNV